MGKKEIKYLLLIIVIFVSACIETDIYLPAFPDMMSWFSASEGEIQGLLTWNFVGICVSGPFYGPISDALGRKKPLVIALGMFLIGSIIAVFSQSLDQMLLGRILQGIGSGGCFTLGTAVIFDAFQKEKAIAALNSLNMVIPLIMAVAPMVGGYLNYTFGFRSNFLAIALFVLVSFIVCLFFFEESLKPEKRNPFHMKSIAKDFKRAFLNLAFWQLTLVMSLLFAGYIAFLSMSSVLFVVEFGMSKTVFPFVQAAVLGGWVLGNLLLNRSLAKWGSMKIKKVGTFFSVIGGVGFGITALAAPTDPYLLTSWIVLYAFGANWVIGLYFPEGMEILPDIKGVTASLLTSVRLAIGALVVGATSLVYNGTIYPLAVVIFGTVAVILPIIIIYELKQRGQAPKERDFSAPIH